MNKIICKAAVLSLVSIASMAANGGEAPHLEKGAVSFYSAEGAALAKKLAIPSPPIQRLPIEIVDPFRKVVATKWQSPFCTAWDDGCTRCERRSADTTPVCGETLEAKSGSRLEKCVPQAVKCREEHDITNFCALGGTNDELLLQGKSYKNMDSSFRVHWVYYYGSANDKPSWQIEIEEEASLPTHRPTEPAVDWSRVSEDIDIFCEEPHTDAWVNPER